MKIYGLTFIVIASFFSFSLFSCKKQMVDLKSDAEIENQFFNKSNDLKPAVVGLLEDVKKNNAKFHFAVSFANKIGFPSWTNTIIGPVNNFKDQSRTNESSNSDSILQTFIIPVNGNGHVKDYIFCVQTIDSIYHYKNFNVSYFPATIPPDSMQRSFMLSRLSLFSFFEHQLNGENEYQFNNVFTPKIKNTTFEFGYNSSGRSNSSAFTFIDIIVCSSVWTPASGWNTGVSTGGTDINTAGSYVTTCTVTSFLTSFDVSNSGGGYDGSGGGGGGSNWGTFDLGDLAGGSGSGTGSGGGTGTSLTLQQKYAYLISTLNLNQSQQFFVSNTSGAINSLYNYLYDNVTDESKDIAIWSINYFSTHPNVNMQIFANQYLGKSEGYEGEFDNYWNDPNLNFPQQNLPHWSDFSNAFPLDSDPLYDTPEKMYNSIGGEVASFYTGPKTNTCAIRLSKALNYSGVIIPHIPNQTFLGADGKYYFKAAYQINIWMRKTFGTNPATSTTPLNTNHFSYNQADAGAHGENLENLLSGKKGIYSIYSSNFQWASGHADLLNPNSTCGNNCHFADAPIYRLDIWILN